MRSTDGRQSRVDWAADRQGRPRKHGATSITDCGKFSGEFRRGLSSEIVKRFDQSSKTGSQRNLPGWRGTRTVSVLSRVSGSAAASDRSCFWRVNGDCKVDSGCFAGWVRAGGGGSFGVNPCQSAIRLAMLSVPAAADRKMQSGAPAKILLWAHRSAMPSSAGEIPSPTYE